VEKNEAEMKLGKIVRDIPLYNSTKVPTPSTTASTRRASNVQLFVNNSRTKHFTRKLSRQKIIFNIFAAGKDS